MKRITRMAGLLIALALGAAAQAASILDQASELASPLSGMLSDQLGVTEDQAEGGIGSMLSLASERLSADDFQKLAGAIPGADGYIDRAKELGAVAGPLKSMADLNGALSKLGISPEMAGRFVPMVTDLVGKVGGDQARSLLAMALGGT